MEKNEYEVMFNVENDYWWYVGLRKTVYAFISKYFSQRKDLKLLDAGCGTGAILARSPTYPVYGFDISEEALKFCKIRRLRNITAASVCDIPFLTDTFDVVVSLDVLCQLDKGKDFIALKELFRVLQKNGVIILNLPAFPFLRSRHDRAVHIQHRYRRQELRKMLDDVGFEVERLTFRNSFLFPFFTAARLIRALFLNNSDEVRSDLKPLPGVINNFLVLLLMWENRLILTGMDFPLGLSLFCIARKRKATVSKTKGP